MTMTKDELVQHLKDAGYSDEAALLAAKDAPEERSNAAGEGDGGNEQPNGHEAMNSAIRSALGQEADTGTNAADAPTGPNAGLNDAIRVAAGRTTEGQA